MLTYYCPKCWTSHQQKIELCPNCGFNLENFEWADYEEKLLASLHHTLPERRSMAAQILGNLQNQKAVLEFKKIIESKESDYYFLRAVILATAKIDHPLRDQILESAAQHYSVLVSEFAKEIILQLSMNIPFTDWDRHTG